MNPVFLPAAFWANLEIRFPRHAPGDSHFMELEERGPRFFADVRTGTYHTSPECPDYTLPRDAWWAYPYYQKEI